MNDTPATAALTTICGLCGAQGAPVCMVHHRQWSPGCAFPGEAVCRLPVSIGASCTHCGREERHGLVVADHLSVLLDMAKRWANGCPGCGAGRTD